MLVFFDDELTTFRLQGILRNKQKTSIITESATNQAVFKFNWFLSRNEALLYFIQSKKGLTNF